MSQGDYIMKKIILSLAACFVIGTAAFAQDYSTVDFGFTFPITFMEDNNYSDAYFSTKAFGVYAEYYEDLGPFFGITSHAFLYFAGHPDFYMNGDWQFSVDDILNPIGFSFNLMPTLNIPIGSVVELRAGLGLGLTWRYVLYDTYAGQIGANQWFLTFPVMAAVQVNFTDKFGLKAGCDVQFKIVGIESYDDYDTSETIDAFTGTILPYVGIVFMF